MGSDERYLPPQSEDLGSRTGQEAPALWNPNAAACWSLLFSPYFRCRAAYVQRPRHGRCRTGKAE